MPEVKEIDKKFQTVEELGPFSSLIRSCKAEVTELHHSELLVSIFGALKVGKSTLGNLLLDKPIFESADTPMTSFVTTFHSEKKSCSKVTFVPFIESVEDIESLLLVAGIDDPELEQQYKDLFLNDGVIDGEKLPDFVARPPPQLRYTPIISHVDIYGPFWDIYEKGIAVADCPGTKEIGALTNVAHRLAANSAVILYVCDGSSRLSKDDEDVSLIRTQIEDGADVIFILNRKAENTDAEVNIVSGLLEVVFGDLVDFSDSPVNVLDIVNDRERLEVLQRELAARLHQRTRVAVSVFLNFFSELIRAQHLFVSRLLTLHVAKQADGMRERTPLSFRTVTDASGQTSPSTPSVDVRKLQAEKLLQETQRTNAKHKAEVKSIQARMKVLWRSCQTKIEEAGKSFDEVVSRTATEFEAQMRLDDAYLSVPVPIAFTPQSAPQRSFIGSIINSQENTFEKEYRRQLQMRLHPVMEHGLNVFGRATKKKFVQYLAQECSSIESSVLELKSEQARLVWNRQSAGLFARLKTDLSRVAPRQQKVAGVAISAVGLVGAATLSAVAMTGILAGGLLTGGALIVLGLFATGIGLSAASMFKDQQTETSETGTRKRTLKRLGESIRGSLQNEHFVAYRQQTVRALDSILSAALHAIATNLIELESVWYLDQCNLTISYETLCQYLWLRDELTDVTNELLDAIREMDVSLQVSTDFSDTVSEGNRFLSSPRGALNSSDHLSLSTSGGIPIPSSHASLGNSTSSAGHVHAAHYPSHHSNTLALKLDRQQIQDNARHDSCYVCWRPRTPCGHLCRDCDFLIGAENCPYCHELPHWIADKIKMSPQARKDLESLLKSAPPALDSFVHTLSRRASASDFSSLHSSSASLGELPSLSSSANISPNSSPAKVMVSGSPPSLPASASSSDLPSAHSQLPSARLAFDEQKQHVQGILVAFKAQLSAFCSWFESKYRRYLTEPAEPDLDVPADMLGSIKYFVNSIISVISQIPSTRGTSLTYPVKLKIVECVHEVIFTQIGPLVDGLVRQKFRLSDQDHLDTSKRGRGIQYHTERNDWSPSKADPMKLQQAIETLRSLALAKSPYAKFQVWTQVWSLIHQAHSEVIAADESWACLTYVIVNAAHAHMASDGFIIIQSLELLLEGEGYMLTTINTFCSPTLMDDVITAELARK